jgi:multiple sugar transport system permease protein
MTAGPLTLGSDRSEKAAARAAKKHRHEHHGLKRTSAPGMIIVILAAIYFLFPIYWLLVSSFKSSSELFATNGFVPAAHFDLFSNLDHVFTYHGSEYLYWIGDTILYAVIGGGLATLFAALAGYAFAKYEFRGRGLLFGIIIGGILVPVTALALPLYLLFHDLSLINTFWAVLLPSLVSPFGVYLARIYASRGVPDEVLDAARIDGAGEFGIFRRVGFRLMAPALVTIFLFQFVAIWNNFFLPLIMLTNHHLYPLALGLYDWNSKTQYAGAPPFLYAAVITGALVAVVPLIVAFALLQRYWAGGLAVGAVKG